MRADTQKALHVDGIRELKDVLAGPDMRGHGSSKDVGGAGACVAAGSDRSPTQATSVHVCMHASVCMHTSVHVRASATVAAPLERCSGDAGGDDAPERTRPGASDASMHGVDARCSGSDCSARAVFLPESAVVAEVLSGVVDACVRQVAGPACGAVLADGGGRVEHSEGIAASAAQWRSRGDAAAPAGLRPVGCAVAAAGPSHRMCGDVEGAMCGQATRAARAPAAAQHAEGAARAAASAYSVGPVDGSAAAACAGNAEAGEQRASCAECGEGGSVVPGERCATEALALRQQGCDEAVLRTHGADTDAAGCHAVEERRGASSLPGSTGGMAVAAGVRGAQQALHAATQGASGSQHGHTDEEAAMGVLFMMNMHTDNVTLLEGDGGGAPLGLKVPLHVLQAQPGVSMQEQADRLAEAFQVCPCCRARCRSGRGGEVIVRLRQHRLFLPHVSPAPVQVGRC